jgi:hypothetical protein
MPAAITDTPSVQILDFEDIGPLIRCARLCDSCSSGQRFAMGFLPTIASRRRSCPSANPSLCRAGNRLSLRVISVITVKQVRPAGRTKKKAARTGRAALQNVQFNRGQNFLFSSMNHIRPRISAIARSYWFSKLLITAGGCRSRRLFTPTDTCTSTLGMR